MPHNLVGLFRLLALATGLLLVGVYPDGVAGHLHPDRDEKIIFSGSSTYTPFQWLDPQGQARGFIIDLQERMAQQGSMAVEHRLMPWEQALHAVDSGEADAIALFASEPRRRRYDFTDPFYYQFHGIFAHAEGDHFSNLATLSGHTVAVTTSSYAHVLLAEEYPDITLLPMESEQACVLAVHSREAEACVEAALNGRRHASELDVQLTSSPFWPRPYVFAVRKGNTELLNWLNYQLAAMQADGTYFAIYQEWLPELEWRQPTMADHLNTIAWIVLPLLLLILISLAGAWCLKRQVARRTRQLAVELKSRRRLERQLRYQVEHDTLTGLLSRQAFIDGLERRLHEEPNWAPTLVFLRLLSLESVTSTFGRTGHEKLLRDFARHLKGLDFPLVSHIGTGAYALVARPDMTPGEASALLTGSFEIEDIRVDPGIVMGLSVGRADDNDDASSSHAEELVRRAITAYASAYADGKPWCIYAPQLQPDPRDLILLHDFRQHGTRDMRLLYQPKLDLASGHIREAEALIRWHHPRLGPIPPGHFIPLLERTGLVTHVTRWVIEEAIEELGRCRVHDSSFGISVNIAARDLADDAKLVDFIRDRGASGSLRGLRLEITETGVIQDHDHTQRVIAMLREAGIPCAVDDFGTGYASLSYLSKFAIEEVKLDRSFIRNMLENRRDKAIIASTIELAHTLGLKVTAEGIEDRETLQALAEMGCDTAQGYVIARPIPATELYPMMERRHFPSLRID